MSATYKVVRVHDHAANFNTFDDFDPEEFRAYYWDRWQWNHLHGERGPKFSETSIFHGYSQGDLLKVHHNGLSKESLEAIESAWRDGFQGVVVRVWNPEPGIGWEYVGSLWGISYLATEEELKRIAADIVPEVEACEVRWNLEDEDVIC